MSGLLALLDDVAAIAKVAAASVDDIAGQAARASMKAAGVVIDDAAVTPKYVAGLDAARELPIIWRIARRSVFNKIVILLPIAMLLSNFAPWLVTPLLMLGGFYLCFEGAEKVWHWLFPGTNHVVDDDVSVKDPTKLEEKRVAGAIKTDFILSAEIMTIILAGIATSTWWTEAIVLGLAGVIITVVVYGAVALIVKMDDVGLKLAQIGRLAATRAFGTWLVKAMPVFMKYLSIVGTAAMIWVGGSILVHGVEVLGWHWPYDTIDDIAVATAVAAPAAVAGFVEWAVTAALDGVIGLAVGIAIIPLATRVIGPGIARLTGKPHVAH